MSNPRPRPKVMMLTEAAAERIKAREGHERRGAPHRRQEGRLRRHGVHHGLGGHAGAVLIGYH
jgi:hypothetical protein